MKEFSVMILNKFDALIYICMCVCVYVLNLLNKLLNCLNNCTWLLFLLQHDTVLSTDFNYTSIFLQGNKTIENTKAQKCHWTCGCSL